MLQEEILEQARQEAMTKTPEQIQRELDDAGKELEIRGPNTYIIHRNIEKTTKIVKWLKETYESIIYPIRREYYAIRVAYKSWKRYRNGN